MTSVCLVIHGGVNEPRCQIGLHDGMREAQPVPACLGKSELGAPGRREPEIEPAFQLTKRTVNFLDDGWSRLGEPGIGLIETDLEPVPAQADACQPPPPPQRCEALRTAWRQP